MFRMRLVLARTASRWVFRTGTAFRVVNAVAAVALVGAGVLLATWPVPLVLASLALLAALYEEAVVIDGETQKVEFRLGLVFWHRTRRFTVGDIAEIRVHRFGPAQFVGLELGLRDGRVFTVENDRGKAATERLTAWGQDLSQALGVPLA